MTDTLDKPQAPKVTGKTVQEYSLVVCFLLGAIVTYFFRIETAGVNLEDVGK